MWRFANCSLTSEPDFQDARTLAPEPQETLMVTPLVHFVSPCTTLFHFARPFQRPRRQRTVLADPWVRDGQRKACSPLPRLGGMLSRPASRRDAGL